MGRDFGSFGDRPRAPYTPKRTIVEEAGDCFDQVKARAKLRRGEEPLSGNGKKAVAGTRVKIKRIF